MEDKILYIEDTKPENDVVVLDLVKKKALAKGIKHVVVASTRGETGVKAVEAFKGSRTKCRRSDPSDWPEGP